MAIEEIWQEKFTKRKDGSGATRERAYRTWKAVCKFAHKKKWDLDPSTITPKQMRLYLAERIEVISPRCVQLEASHLRRAIKGAGQKIGDVRDPENPWSSARMQVPKGSRIGGKTAANPVKLDAVRDQMPPDILAALGLIEALGLRRKEALMSDASLGEWMKELEKPESNIRGADLRIDRGTKGGRPRYTFIPVAQIDSVVSAVRAAQVSAALNRGFVVVAEELELAMKRYTNCLYRLGLRGDDSGHGIRRAFAHRQFVYYRDRGLTETKALKKLSHDLGHGDGRGRWVWNNYLLGGTA